MNTGAQTDATASSGMTLGEAQAENGRLQGELDLLRGEHALFMRAISHELCTALQAAAGFAELLEQEVRRKKPRYRLRMIRQEHERLAWVAGELHLQAELQGDGLRFEPVVIQIVPLLEGAIRTWEAHSPSHMFYTEWQPDLACAFADPRRVRQVLDSLLTYAVRFSIKGYSEMNAVSLAASTHGDFVEIAIRGEWLNIVPGYADRIFDRIVGSTTSQDDRPQRGLWLGLYAARQIARRLNGDLVLRNGLEQRLALVFSLPIAQ